MTDLRFAKVNVRVRDLDAALAYARDVLGAEVLREKNTISFGDMALVRYGGLTIEIIAPDQPDSPLAQLIDKRGEGIDSIGFYADDFDGEVGELDGKGVRFSSNDGRLAWVHPKNPLSTSIELLNSEHFPGGL
jgi:catechol 2,3-dioxygenase-like lactoylglutathione lyase family enzyme